MNATTTHRLPGLEPDNLLAFLALLGLLRALNPTFPTRTENRQFLRVTPVKK